MKAMAAFIIILALVIGILPQFANCGATGAQITKADGTKMNVVMKCHWTAQGEIAVGAPLLVLGITSFFSKRKESKRIMAVMGASLGAFAILLPTLLIGVCANSDMLCNNFMRPAMILSGILVIGVSVVSLVISERKME